MQTNYQTAKEVLKNTAVEAKNNSNDKPLIRMVINDTADSLTREFNLSDHRINLLHNYAAKLHPK